METQNKLSIEHIAKRLPYGLKVKLESTLYPTPQIVGIVRELIYMNYNGASVSVPLEKVKPLLFPLSSLTETITIKGESFVPIEVLKSNSETPYALNLRLEENNFVFDTQIIDSEFGNHRWNDVTFYCGNQLEMFEKLLEWHFDLPSENLIEKGLAISVLELTENPYA